MTLIPSSLCPWHRSSALFCYFWAAILLLPRSDVHTGSLACLHSYPSISMAGCPLKQGAEPISTRQGASPLLAQTGTEAETQHIHEDPSWWAVWPKEDLVFHSRERSPWQSLITVHCVHCTLLLIRKEMSMMGFWGSRILLLK